jgi:hypothetical protein
MVETNMNGWVVFFSLVGMIAIGALVGLIITPFILYLSTVVAYALALGITLIRVILTSKQFLNVFPKLLKEFPKYTNKPVYESNNSKAAIDYPNPSKDDKNPMIDRGIITATCEQIGYTSRHTSYCPSNQNVPNMPKQPSIKKVSNIIQNVFHRIILFYKSYYGHSTKVEKNQ